MIEISFAAGQCVVVLGWILFRLAAYLKCKKIDWKQEAKQLFFLVNLLVIYRCTFHPFAKVDGQVQPLVFDKSAIFPIWLNLVPFKNLLDYEIRSELLINIIGNVTMFIPTGIMTPMIYKKLKSFPKTLLTGAMISLVIEILQLPFAGRASDVDDLILNTLGCVIGYGIYALVRKLKRK